MRTPKSSAVPLFKVAVLPALLILAACDRTNGKVGSSGTQVDDDLELISNRSAEPFFTALVRLRSPALLTTAQQVDGKWVVDEAVKAKIIKEQNAFIKSIKSMPGGRNVRVLYKFHFTLNAVSVLAPIEMREKFLAMPGVLDIEEDETFEPPETRAVSAKATDGELDDVNSVNFIGADKVKELGFTGQGIRVGVVDTGIDYTHKMFGGAGTAEAYKNNDPNQIEADSFPTAKVAGGIDLVGTEYNTSGPTLGNRIPHPDADPLDEAGHGTHVAGTVAGKGDGTNTYDGMAPDAALYAIKIFGKSGSTGTSPILAAFEFAADPNGDLDMNDKLDVLNLSLGSGFGTRFSTYGEAIKNLASVGTVTAASAGNSGQVPFIVGAPSTAEEAISVAASIDNSPWNWKFDGVKFSVDGKDSVVQAFDATFTKPSVEAEGVTGTFVFIGTAATELDQATKDALKGNIALVDRGVVAFFDKIKRAAEAGATGVVVANNIPGPANRMGGGDGMTTFNIPAVMITLDLGKQIKAALQAQKPASVTFGPGFIIEKPELIDSVTGFSSRGPRSLDGLIKPEISAPGQAIISAAMGSGDQGVAFSGTSMASPHIAGAIALMRQALPLASAADIKTRMMNTSSSIKTVGGAAAAGVAEEGAGRINVLQAIQGTLTISPPALSLGIITASKVYNSPRTLTLHNEGKTPVTATFTYPAEAGLTVSGPATVTVAPESSTDVELSVSVDVTASEDTVIEVDGRVKVLAGSLALQIPVLAEGKRGSAIELGTVKRPGDGKIEIDFANTGATEGELIPFNLLGSTRASSRPQKNGPCQVASVGYRVVPVQLNENTTIQMLEFGVKLGSEVSSWRFCELSVQFDTNNDGIADQELGGATLETNLWPPNQVPRDPAGSFLVDANKMRQIQIDNTQPDAGFTPDSAAVIDIMPFARYNFSNIGIVMADLSKVARTANGLLKVKVGALPFYEGGIRDHFLGGSDGEWLLIDPDHLPFANLPDSFVLAAQTGTAKVAVTRTEPGSLLFLMPTNDSSVGTSVTVKGSR